MLDFGGAIAANPGNLSGAAAGMFSSAGGAAALSGVGGAAGGIAASAGMFSNPVGLALAGGQLAFGLGKMLLGNQIDTQAAYNQAYNITYQNELNKARVEAQNKQIAAQFTARLDYVKNQIENNFIAADSSWVAEQMRLNDINDRAAYQSQAMEKMLSQALGSSAAREVYGKSARRGALLSTLGNYGRTKAQQAHQLLNEQTASQKRMQQTEQQYQAANKQALAQVSVLPAFAMAFDQPIPAATGPSPLQTALQIGTIGMQAFQTGLSVTPKEMNFFGVPGLANYG